MSICLHTLFEEKAALHPNAIAVKFQSNEITYQQLNEQSNQLANYLRSRGVRTGDKVSLYLERSIDMMIAIFGILKAGAAYAPINPKDPPDRFDFLLDDVGSSIIVTSNNLFKDKNCKQKVILLDVDHENILACSTDSQGINIPDAHIAVILYTSGSTGFPKGVLLSHGSLVNRLIWDRKAYNHTPDDIVLQHASYTFDFSVLEMFIALANGGKLILARPEFYYEGLYLIELIQKEKITKMGSGPSLLKAYIDLPAFENCTSLKQVFLGGETLSSNLQNTFFKKSSAELINIYGPTETSISVLHWTCKRNSKENIVPVGFPVADMRIYLLDENNEPVPDGGVGEIYISGAGVGNGYHNRPEMTAERFLPDSFVKDKDARMYRSGDLGKKLSNGSIQFMGRKDYQIKMHGLRIELQEIEHHIMLHENINSCVVAGIENKSNEIKLVAYVIPALGMDLNIGDIKNYLLSKLPDYMVPTLFVEMNEFPLSPNGKVDRKALPYPDNVRLLSQTSYNPPTNENQRQLVRIWEQVLQLKPIGINDSFDKIGGDSLATVEILRLMESEMRCKLPLSSFAHASTIKHQADIINTDKCENKLIQLCCEGEKTPVIFIGGVQGEGTLSSTFMKYLRPGHPFLLTMPFGVDSETVPDSIEEITRHYVQELEKQYPHKEYIVGGYSMGGLVALEMASILKNKCKSLFLVDTFHPSVLRNEIDNYKIVKRIYFYLNRLVKSDIQTKIIIVKYLINGIKRIFKQEEKHPLFRKIQMTIGINIDAEKYFSDDKNLSLSLQYAPRPYNEKALLISAKKEIKSYSYEDLIHQNAQEESIRKWTNDIFGKLQTYEIPGEHTAIMKEPAVISVAHLINEHILKD